MKLVAWSSASYNEEMGGAIYLLADGREIEVCEVAEVPDSFVWPPPPKPTTDFHVDDDFEGPKGPPFMWRWGDLVLEGETTKFLRLSPRAHERAVEESLMERATEQFLMERDDDLEEGI